MAQMENDAVRFENGVSEAVTDVGGLDFIVKDLQLNEHLRESARAAELVQHGLRSVHTGPDKGVKQAGFMVLTTARRPAILVELGYSTNPQDGRLLDPAQQPEGARGGDRRFGRGVPARVRAQGRHDRGRGAMSAGLRVARLGLGAVTLLLLGGCVYYNGMYNTKRLAGSARKAEREGRTLRDANNLWGQVVTRADILVVRHPDSKYVDEALTLKGIALARLNQCANAVRPLSHGATVTGDAVTAEESGLALGRCQTGAWGPRGRRV